MLDHLPYIQIQLPKFLLEGRGCNILAIIHNQDPSQEVFDVELEIKTRSCAAPAVQKLHTSLRAGLPASANLLLETQDKAGDTKIYFTLHFKRCPMFRESIKWEPPRGLSVLSADTQSANVIVNQGYSTHQEGRLAGAGSVASDVGNRVIIDGSHIQTLNDLLKAQTHGTMLLDFMPNMGRHHFAPEVFDNSCAVNMRPISVGVVFQQGSPQQEVGRDADNEIIRQYTMITTPFWMAAHEVTQKAWSSVMEVFPANCKHHGDQLPITAITWDQAVEFCQRLTAREHATRLLPLALEYRLPTEAEWEYCCRAGTSGPHYAPLLDIAHFDKKESGPLPVGSLQPNPWGLYDMLGNCFEWCLDSYTPHYDRSQREDPFCFYHDPEKDAMKVIRGGSYHEDANYARAAARISTPASRVSGRIGFRIVAAFRDKNPLLPYLSLS